MPCPFEVDQPLLDPRRVAASTWRPTLSSTPPRSVASCRTPVPMDDDDQWRCLQCGADTYFWSEERTAWRCYECGSSSLSPRPPTAVRADRMNLGDDRAYGPSRPFTAEPNAVPGLPTTQFSWPYPLTSLFPGQLYQGHSGYCHDAGPGYPRDAGPGYPHVPFAAGPPLFACGHAGCPPPHQLRTSSSTPTRQ